MIERTFDYRKVKKIIGKNPIISSEVIYLIENDYLLYFLPFKDGIMIHVNDHKPCKGKEVKQFAIDAIDWCFKNTETDVIYAEILKDNKPSQRMACLVGMTRDYVNDNVIYYKVKKDVENKAA